MLERSEKCSKYHRPQKSPNRSKFNKKKSEISLNTSMFKMFAIICAVTVFECNTMYENPPRLFDTKEQCMVAAQMKKDLTIEALTDEDGHLTVEHFEVGCELVESV